METLADHRHEIRVVYALLGPGLIIHLGQAMDDLTRFIEAFQRIFVGTMAALFALAAAIGGFMARRALAGVETVTRAAQRIAADGRLWLTANSGAAWLSDDGRTVAAELAKLR